MIVAIVNFLHAWRRYNASLHELYQLGDRELADIGITRSDIPRIAWDTPTAEHPPRKTDENARLARAFSCLDAVVGSSNQSTDFCSDYRLLPLDFRVAGGGLRGVGTEKRPAMTDWTLEAF